MTLDFDIRDIAELDSSVTLAASAIDYDDWHSITELNDEKELKTASVPKIFLLMQVARRIASGTLSADQMIDRRDSLNVRGSGLWQHLQTDKLPLYDVAALVGSFSDNTATNALLDLVSLESVQKISAECGCVSTKLNDYVRMLRIPGEHPETVSNGSAIELANVVLALEDEMRKGTHSASLVIEWLRSNVDCSMVLAPFNIDPTSHHDPNERGFRVWSKTGSDSGVRADVGVIVNSRKTISYSVITNWDPKESKQDVALEMMRRVGDRILRYCLDA